MQSKFVLALILAVIGASIPSHADPLSDAMSMCVNSYNMFRTPKLSMEMLARCGYSGTKALPFCGMNPTTFSPIVGSMNATCCFPCRPCNADAMSTCSLSIPFCNSTRVTSFKGCCPACKPGFTPSPTSGSGSGSGSGSSLLPPLDLDDDDIRITATNVLNPCTAAILSALPFCSDSLQFAINTTTRCPVCRPRDGRSYSCSIAQVEACVSSAAQLPVCMSGINPIRDPETCCLSCRPASDSIPSINIANRNKCDSDAQKAQCKDRIINNKLRACNSAIGEEPAFNASSCCLTCTKVAPQEFRPVQGECKRETFAQCMKATLPCRPGDFAIQVKASPTASCCPSCVRPETTCSAEQVVSCKRSMRTCVSGETPTVLDGECCPTCKLNVTSAWCNPACGAGQFCMRSRASGVWTAKCTPVNVLQLLFNATDADRRATMAAWGVDEVKLFVNEMVGRYCETRPELSACKLFLARGGDLDGNVTRVQPLNAYGGINITLAVPNRPIVDADSSDGSAIAANPQSVSIGNMHAIKMFGAVQNKLQQAADASFSDLVTATVQDPYASTQTYSTSVSVQSSSSSPSSNSPTTATSAAVGAQAGPLSMMMMIVVAAISALWM